MTAARTEPILVMTTISGESAAHNLAKHLVESRLAGCVNRTAVASVYRWKGAVQEEPEIMLLIKTTRARLQQLQQEVLEKHPYDLPEFLVLPIVGGTEDYLKWLQDSV